MFRIAENSAKVNIGFLVGHVLDTCYSALMKIEFLPIKTRVVQPPHDEIWDILDGLDVRDGDIVFITSKILAIHQGRCVKVGEAEKVDLIRRESTHWLPYQMSDGYNVNLTITDNILIPAAGIDESNANGHYILWPEGVDALCREIREYLISKSKCAIKNLGVVSTDSHTTPLRWGVTGITTGVSGIKVLEDIRGREDIFGRPLNLTKVNMIDPLTSMAVKLMGEANEQVPIVILRDYKGIQFDANGNMDDFKIDPEEDLYKPLLDVFKKSDKNIK